MADDKKIKALLKRLNQTEDELAGYGMGFPAIFDALRFLLRKELQQDTVRSRLERGTTGTWTKRDNASGKFMDVKPHAKPFSGVRKTKRPLEPLPDC